MTANDRGTASGMSESTASAMVGASGVATPAGVAPDRFFKYWLIVPAIFLLLLVGLFPLIYSLVVSFQSLTMLEQDYSFAGLANYIALFKDGRLWESLASHRPHHRHRAAAGAGARPADGAAVPGAAAGPADLRLAAGAADHHLADRRRRHLAPAVRQPLRADQPDHRLVRGRAEDRCCGPSIRTWSIRRSCCARSGSGRRSCS